ncbi:hypothetical protein [Streptomyces chartreusis]|jgi:hypothetical protein|uniref:hypothetical protein n=1 Tax=Streptomyces chartreusis TaxID=1969 RepID=UPI003868D108|nr:hypothetical protein OG938_31675 [Streptomyces chartreusis]
MTSRWPIPRPTEHAALRACDRSPRPAPGIPAILADLITANAAGDREGICLLGHRAVRAAQLEVGE